MTTRLRAIFLVYHSYFRTFFLQASQYWGLMKYEIIFSVRNAVPTPDAKPIYVKKTFSCKVQATFDKFFMFFLNPLKFKTYPSFSIPYFGSVHTPSIYAETD